MPKLVHAADLHLDSPLLGLERYESAPLAELRRATRDALDRLVELCITEAAGALVVAGDLFDGNWRDYSTGLFLAERMARLRDAGVEVVWIRGNHDAASRLTRHLRMPENVRELGCRMPESVELERLNLVVHGQGFARAAIDEDLSLRYPAPVSGAFNVGLLHTALDGREGHDPYAPCTVGGLVDRGYEYFALGHVHAHEVVHREPWIVYPGNLQGRHARETGPKGAVLVSYEGARVVGVEARAVDVVRWLRPVVDAAGATSLDDVGDRVRSALEAACRDAGQRLVAARVRLTGATRAHEKLHSDPERLLSTVRHAALEVQSGSVWIEKVELATKPDGDGRALGAAGPLADLLREVTHLRADPAALTAFLADVPGLADLSRKVRPELGSAEVSPTALLDDALGLLLSRLAEVEPG